jgi:hypothetical protein
MTTKEVDIMQAFRKSGISFRQIEEFFNLKHKPTGRDAYWVWKAHRKQHRQEARQALREVLNRETVTEGIIIRKQPEPEATCMPSPFRADGFNIS